MIQDYDINRANDELIQPNGNDSLDEPNPLSQDSQQLAKKKKKKQQHHHHQFNLYVMSDDQIQQLLTRTDNLRIAQIQDQLKEQQLIREVQLEHKYQNEKEDLLIDLQIQYDDDLRRMETQLERTYKEKQRQVEQDLMAQFQEQLRQKEIEIQNTLEAQYALQAHKQEKDNSELGSKQNPIVV